MVFLHSDNKIMLKHNQSDFLSVSQNILVVLHVGLKILHMISVVDSSHAWAESKGLQPKHYK